MVIADKWILLTVYDQRWTLNVWQYVPALVAIVLFVNSEDKLKLHTFTILTQSATSCECAKDTANTRHCTPSNRLHGVRATCTKC